MDKTEFYLNACLVGDAVAIDRMIRYEDKRFKNIKFLHHCLNVACGAGDLVIVNKLLGNKYIAETILNYRCPSVFDTLYWACKSGNSEIIHVVLNMCTRSYYYQHVYNNSIWHYTIMQSCMLGDIDIVKLCETELVCSGDYINDCFTQACKTNNIDLLTYIADKGIIYYDECLFYACKHGNLKTIEFLIKKGSVNWSRGLTGACLGGHLNVAKLMIKKGASYISHNFANACGGGSLGIVKLIIKHGIYSYSTGLDYACKNGQIHIVKFLLKYHHFYNMGEYLLTVCSGFGLPEKQENERLNIVKLLLKYNDRNGHVNIDINGCLNSACSNGHLEIAKILVEREGGANNWDKGLVNACLGKHIDLVKLMLKCGAVDLNTALYESTHPYELSRKEHAHACNDICKLLVKSGATEFSYFEYSEDFQLYNLNCIFRGTNRRNDDYYLLLLQEHPPYVMFIHKVCDSGNGGNGGNRVSGSDCHINKLPVELFRLLFAYL